MGNKRFFLLAALLISLPMVMQGQGISIIKNRIARPDAMQSATVTVNEHGSAASAISSYDNSRKPLTIQGYRIRIFFDNSQTARSEAYGTQSRFRSE